MPIARRLVLRAALGVTVLAAPLLAWGQSAPKVPRIGVLGERSPSDSFVEAFRQGLRDLGYVEERNIAVEYRYAHGDVDRIPKLVSEIVQRHVDVMVVGGSVSALAARAAAPTMPIVFTTIGDPVASGLVTSLGRPGGNVTGLSNLLRDLAGKQLELLKAAVPQLTRVTILYNPRNPTVGGFVEEAQQAARALGLTLQTIEIRQANELASVFSSSTAWRAGALVAMSDPVFGNHLARLAQLAVTHRLPSIYSRREFTESGGLLAYGPSFEDNYRRAATYVDKILKGAKPADLPVEQPTKIEFAINLKTARALGLTVPQALVGRADHLIQ